MEEVEGDGMVAKLRIVGFAVMVVELLGVDKEYGVVDERMPSATGVTGRKVRMERTCMMKAGVA